MAYEVVMPYHLHMPSYFLETFTEYPYRVVTLARLSYHINYITNPSNNSIYSPMASSISDTIIYSSAV